jgi:putative monooxygenase
MKTVNIHDVAGFKSGTGDLKVLLSQRTVGAKNALLGYGRMEPGTSIPAEGQLGAHPVEEYSYVISGQIAVWVEGEERVLVPGDSMYINVGQRHVFRNLGTEPAEFIWVLSPGMDL